VIVLGLHGYARAGKDTFADALVENYGFVKIAFADALRDVLLDFNPPLRVTADGPVYLAEVIGEIGWEQAKDRYPELRQLMIVLGEAIRRHLHPRAWILAALAKVPDDANVVFSDVRSLAEARAIREKLGGQIVHIIRPGITPAPGETILPAGLISWEIRNDKDITWLRACADMLMLRYKEWEERRR